MCEVAGSAVVNMLANKAMDARSEAQISRMDAALQASARLGVNLSALSGNPVRVTTAFRSFKEQEDIYAQGRTMPGNVVTQARGGDSYHNYGRAMDLAPVEAGLVNVHAPPSQQTVGIMTSLGWEWGGSWRKPDRPHFQKTGGQSIAELKSGRQP